MKRTLAIVLALVMVLALVACTGTTPEQPTTTGNDLAGTYDITVWVGENAVDLTKKQIEDFNNSNEFGIKFNATVNPVSEATSADQMLVDISAGADIYCFAQDQFARLVQGGALNRLGDKAAETVRAANDPGVVAAATSGDTLYAYPLTSDNGYWTAKRRTSGLLLKRTPLHGTLRPGSSRPAASPNGRPATTVPSSLLKIRLTAPKVSSLRRA